MSSLVYMGYKLVKVFVYPYVWIGIFLGVSVGLLLGKPTETRWRTARFCTVFAFLLFYMLGFGPVSAWLASLLEEQHPPPILETTSKHDAIVVLGGGIRPAGGLRPVHELGESTMRRTLCGATLIRQGHAPVIVFSGGNADPFLSIPPESGEMKKLAIKVGVPDKAILLESASRNTYESAKEVKNLLGHQKHILLVTSAMHLPRAVRLYQKQGFRLTPVPCGYTVGGTGWGPFTFVPSAGALRQSSQAINEIVGMAVYWMAGKI